MMDGRFGIRPPNRINDLIHGKYDVFVMTLSGLLAAAVFTAGDCTTRLAPAIPSTETKLS